ncbi:hypothetical protein [Bifidobacterium moukalabense]|uniref:hypothetical protein n=1 Tax=Bifidobacterium moukalabense TaxID=1333651 RepID=UPI0010F46132|nr:hypothetical protein [Bifidobacterium moukalabense]
MKDIDIAIGILDKLIAREREAANNGMRMDNRILEENASARYYAYIMARDEIRDALAANGREERDDLATSDMSEEDTPLNGLIEWLSKERDYVLQWRGKDRKGLVNDPVRPVDFWTHEADVYARVIRHCESMLGHGGPMPTEVKARL